MKNLHLVTMEKAKQVFKYILGVFNSGRKAEVAAQYELERRRSTNMPGTVTPRIMKIEVDKIYSNLNVEALDSLLQNRA